MNTRKVFLLSGLVAFLAAAAGFLTPYTQRHWRSALKAVTGRVTISAAGRVPEYTIIVTEKATDGPGAWWVRDLGYANRVGYMTQRQISARRADGSTAFVITAYPQPGGSGRTIESRWITDVAKGTYTELTIETRTKSTFRMSANGLAAKENDTAPSTQCNKDGKWLLVDQKNVEGHPALALKNPRSGVVDWALPEFGCVIIQRSVDNFKDGVVTVHTDLNLESLQIGTPDPLWFNTDDFMEMKPSSRALADARYLNMREDFVQKHIEGYEKEDDNYAKFH